MSENLRNWTVLVYFAADNDLEGAALLNQFHLEQLTSTDEVHLLTQLDVRSQRKAKRYFLAGPGKSIDEELTEPNTGSAEALIDFVKWGMGGDHKAHNYLLIIWGHGTGIDDYEDDPGTIALRHAALRTKVEEVEEVEAVPEKMLELAAEPQPLSFSGPKAKSFGDIGGDDTPSPAASGSGMEEVKTDGPDALTCVELRHVFGVIREELLGKKVAIFGMDACLMSMAEVAQQVSDSVELMVASQEVVPNTSWPYERILPELRRNPAMTPEQLARLIVDQYVAHYDKEAQPVTLSVCNLSKTKDLTDALAELGHTLGTLVRDDELRKAITRARRRTQVFRFRDFIDLHHFCEVLQETLKVKRFAEARARAEEACRAAESACQRVMRVIEGENGAGSGFVIYPGNTSAPNGPLANARGVSIYFPPLPPTYADLALNDSTRWDSFLHAYMNAVFRPHALRGASAIKRSNGSNGHEIMTEGEIVNMSANATPERKPRLLLPKGTTVKDATGGFEETLTTHAYVLLEEKAKIKVPKDTELDVPLKGTVKASSGTSTKATSGTRSNAVASVELVLPACTLNRPLTGKNVELSDGTIAKTAGGKDSDPFVVLDNVEFEVQS